MERRRIEVSDWEVLHTAGPHVIVGEAFAFVQPQALDAGPLRWVRRLLGHGRPAVRVVPLLDRGPVDLLGARIRAALPSMFLASVTTDKAVYRAGRDVVRVLVVRPFHPGSDEVLDLRVDGQAYGSRAVRLDAHGVAALELRDLPIGAWSVSLRGQPDSMPASTFTVAEYRLAPLVATIVERRLDGPRLSLALRLETLGVAVEGDVHVELTDDGRRAWRGTARAAAGALTVDLRLEGRGPFAVQLQLVDHPSRTATVSLLGSRAAERELTVFSSLGTTVEGSLMPLDDARDVRGISLAQGAARSTPFALDRVDAARARLVARCRVESGVLVVLDPSWPEVRPLALDPADPRIHESPLYRSGEQLFKQGELAMALTAFREGRAREGVPHPYWAYYEACCLAGLGRAAEALGALRVAIADGWRDLEHMRRDDDLASLRDLPAFTSLLRGGVREVPFETLEAGQAVEVEVPAPAAVLAIGAWVGDKPWEGWAVAVVPPDCTATVEVPSEAEPGADVDIVVHTGLQRPASVHLVVKDARLPASDSPQTRLAAAIKTTAAQAGARLGLGHPKATLAGLAPPPAPPPASMPRGGTLLGPVFAQPLMAVERAIRYAPPLTLDYGAPPACAEEVAAAPVDDAPPPLADEPEVLFAGLLDAPDGTARVTVRLGPAVAAYVVEALVADGPQWASGEARLQAARQPFVCLELAAFVHPADAVQGRVTAACASGSMRVEVWRDGEPLALPGDGLVEAHRAELSFAMPAGDYRAVVTDRVSGATHQAGGRVQVPGRLRRRTRAVRLLQAGDDLRRADETAVRALRVLPGLDAPFRALVEATADYGHACCEQTAAKMIAAAAMYAMGNGQRAMAESIFLAGVKREEGMWLPGRGFKMYPESASEPDDFWGARAARYLWSMALLDDGRALTAALAAGIERCTEMARDACRAYRIEWPPKAADTPEDAWNMLRFGEASQAPAALARLRAVSPDTPSPLGVVGQRADCAYAAAGLLRGGIASDRAQAVRLANRVTADLGPEGRLYSTVDSVAAVAMMAELRRAGVTDGRGEVNGRPCTAQEAVALTGAIDHVRVLEGTLTIEVEREVEEDWEAFEAGLDVAVSLERDGHPVASVRPGEALELVVRLHDAREPGDLAWVCLPEALSRLVGGAQVKQFSVDFLDAAEVRVPLAATAATRGPQHLAVCVRNMFAEERAGSPGLLEVVVSA